MVVGLTGRSCAGKDTVARLLDREKFFVIDEDSLGHQALASRKEELAAAFGDGIIAPDGSVDRRKLGPIVFADREKLETLNAITHPWMHDETIRLCRTAEEKGMIAVINAALLESMGFVTECDEVILVEAPYSVRAERAFLREGISEERFRDRDRQQAEIGSTLRRPDVRLTVIVNDGDGYSLSRQVNILCDRLLKEAFLWERRQE